MVAGNSTVDALAVYGSLRRGFDNHQRVGIADLPSLGACLIPGRLYDLGAYPGLKLGQDGVVRGELYECTNADFERLDCFEGAVEPNPLYERKSVALVDPSRSAWVYEFAGDVSSVGRIESGDWRAYSTR